MPALLRNWLIVYLGNFAAALSVAVAVLVARTHASGGGAFGVAALDIAAAKLPARLLAGGRARHPLQRPSVCLAVWLMYSARSTADRILAVVLPVTVGNIIGGAVLVGAVYWFVYLRPRR